MSLITNKLKALARDWRVKIAIQNTLSLLPGNAGFRINEQITQFVRGSMEARIESKKRFLKGIDNIHLIRNNVEEFNLKDRTILELGTGWHGVDLVIFYLLGAKNIITIDHYPHLTLAYMVSTIETLLNNSDVVSRLIELGLLPDRVSVLEASIAQASSLAELLKSLEIDYQIVTSAEYKYLTIKQQPVDFFYSESILHRLPVKHLQDLLQVVSGCLSNDAVIFHRTDQSDINAQRHVDTELWALNYLRYSEWFFNLFMSGKFNSQNRLRESDFLQLLDESGMSPIYLESHCRKDDMDRLRNFKVARRFKDKTIEDLSVKHSKIVCKKRLASGVVDLKREVIYT